MGNSFSTSKANNNNKVKDNSSQSKNQQQTTITEQNKKRQKMGESEERSNEPNMAPMDDEHNIELVRLVGPRDHKNPTPAADFVYDLIAIGAGAGGLVSAKQTARRGFKSALIEGNLAGGDCLNYGCVPSKALLRCAHNIKELKESAEYGVTHSGFKVDFGAIMKRMRRLRAKIAPDDSYEGAMNVGADVYQGWAKFTGPNSLEVNGQELKFKKCVVASGGKPFSPPIKGLDTVPYLNNENLFHMTEQPKHLVVVGGGPIGLEMAQAFCLFGTKVTVVSHELLMREDPDARNIVKTQMEKDGVEFVLGSMVEYVKMHDSKPNTIVVCGTVEGKNRLFECDQILVATGRVPNVKGLNLEAAKIDYSERHGVTINDNMQTSNPDIYAVGDVTPAHKFTHLSGTMAVKVVENIFFGYDHKLSEILLPWVTYTFPEVAHVGVYEHDAKFPVDVYTASLEHNDRAILESATDGFVRIICKKGTDEIVGGTIVGASAGEMISEITLAIQFKIGLGENGMFRVVHSYPTQADSVGACAWQYKAKTWKYKNEKGEITGGE